VVDIIFGFVNFEKFKSSILEFKRGFVDGKGKPRSEDAPNAPKYDQSLHDDQLFY
jgi:hypothetical protein